MIRLSMILLVSIASSLLVLSGYSQGISKDLVPDSFSENIVRESPSAKFDSFNSNDTSPDSTSPIIGVLTFPSILNLSDNGARVEVSVTDNVEVDTVIIHYKKATIGSYQSLGMEEFESSYLITLDTTKFDEHGLIFFVEAKDLSDNSVTSQIESIWKEFRSGEISIPNLLSSRETLDYSIISIPFQSEPVEEVFRNIDATVNDEWRLAHYESGTDYNFYPSDFDLFEPGKGYWFLTEKNADFSLSGGRVVKATEETPFTINLKANQWNMIGNPYLFEIDWQAVIDHNESRGVEVSELVTFQDRSYNSSVKTLAPYQGALVFSNQAVTIEIPVNTRNSTGSSRRNEIESFDTNHWKLPISVENEYQSHNVSVIGMMNNSSSGDNYSNWLMLPRLSSYLDIGFNDHFSRSVIPVQEEHVWDFSVNSSHILIETTINWDKSFFLNTDKALYLVDLTNQKFINAEAVGSYSFTQVNESMPFRLVYGDENEITNLLKEGHHVGELFPNPSDDQFSIPLVLFEKARVNISIHDLSGRIIKELEPASFEKGIHQYSVEIDEAIKGTCLVIGEIVSSGVKRETFRRKLIFR